MTPLGYRDKLRRAPSGTVRAAALVCLASAVAATAFRIEVLNAAAGGTLPARELREGGQTHVKRRNVPWTDEAQWRRLRGPLDDHGAPVARELTASERAVMEQDIRQAIASNALLGVVSTWGLSQYVLVPIAFVLGFALVVDVRLKRWMRTVGGAGMVIALTAAALLWHRAYYSSLGW